MSYQATISSIAIKYNRNLTETQPARRHTREENIHTNVPPRKQVLTMSTTNVGAPFTQRRAKEHAGARAGIIGKQCQSHEACPRCNVRSGYTMQAERK